MPRSVSCLREARSILVIQVSRIGDTLLATPALRAVAAAWPQASITVLGHPKRVEVLEHLPFLSSVGAITKGRARWRGRLPGKRFDLAFVFGHDEPLIEYAMRVARHVVAFRQRNAVLTQRLDTIAELPGFQERHAVDYLLALLEPLGVPVQGRYLSYRVTTEERRWASNELRQVRTAGGGPLVGLQVASFPTRSYRDWPLEHFAALCERVLARYPKTHFLILGGAEESARTADLERRLGKAATRYAGRLTLRQSAALMNELDLYVGVDTGPTHIMGALKRPMIAMYHATSPSRILAPLEHPCLYAIDHPKAGKPASPETSMSEITVDHVSERALEALGTHYKGLNR
jgi:heptosyltransferase-3